MYKQFEYVLDAKDYKTAKKSLFFSSGALLAIKSLEPNDLAGGTGQDAISLLANIAEPVLHAMIVLLAIIMAFRSTEVRLPPQKLMAEFLIGYLTALAFGMFAIIYA